MVNISGPGHNAPNIKPSNSVEEAQSRSKQLISRTNSEANIAANEIDQADLQGNKKNQIKEKRHVYDKSDIMNQLLNFGKSPSSKNIHIGMAMLSYGIPFNQEYFEMVDNLMKGKNSGKDLEAIVLTLSKNLGGNSKSISILKGFLSNEHNLSQSLTRLQYQLKQFHKALIAMKGALEPALIQQMGMLLGSFDDKIKFLKNGSKNPLALKVESQQTFIKDLKLFNSLLKGLDTSVIDKLDSRQLHQKIKTAFNKIQNTLSSTLDHLLVYQVLSKESQFMINETLYQYWQIPNLMAENERNIDLLIKKKNNRQDSEINSDQSELIMKFNTENLGEVCIIINVQDRTLTYQFHNEKGETKQLVASLVPSLIEQMKAMNYDVKKVENIVKKVALKPLICPSFDLDNLTHISTEA